MPKYAALIYTPAEAEGQGTPDEWAQVMAEYTEFGEKAEAAGVVVGARPWKTRRPPPPSTSRVARTAR